MITPICKKHFLPPFLTEVNSRKKQHKSHLLYLILSYCTYCTYFYPLENRLDEKFDKQTRKNKTKNTFSNQKIFL